MAETEEKKSTISELTVDGYTFKVDTDLMDDVEAFEYIDRIENKGQIAAIVPLLTFMIGGPGYAQMKEFYAKQDAERHAEELKAAGEKPDTGYKGRFRMKKLQEVYLAIVEKFNPKD